MYCSYLSLNYVLCVLIGANSSLTAAAVVLTGVVGANFVQTVMDKLRLDDPIARGIATASRYHVQPSYKLTSA